jgi:peroxiredoxin Q/BCP
MLLADHDRVVTRAFGVRLMLGMPHRQSFLIRERRVVWRDLHASTGEQARDVLKALAEGQGAESGLK